MAMRLFSKQDFHDELRKYGLEPTGFKTETQELWALKEDPTKIVFVVADQEKVPDYVLDTILKKLHKLYHPEGDNLQNNYIIKPTADVIELKSAKS